MKGDEDSVQRGKPRTNGKRIAEVKERKRIADGYQTDSKRRTSSLGPYYSILPYFTLGLLVFMHTRSNTYFLIVVS